MSASPSDLKLYAHPFSSYCQKALVALYENRTPFEYKLLESEESMRELEALWPLKRFPVLVDRGHTVFEASIIVEHLGLHYPGPTVLIPGDTKVALQVRKLDRFFDNYVQTPLQKVVFDAICNEPDRDPYGVAQARAMLGSAYAWLDRHMVEREWAATDEFSLADCAAAPALFYADWVQRIGEEHAHVHAYRRRLLARPSFARLVEEARPYRSYFPLGAPDRD